MDLLTSLTARWTGFMTILIVVMSMRCWPMSFTSVANSAQVCRGGLVSQLIIWQFDEYQRNRQTCTKASQSCQNSRWWRTPGSLSFTCFSRAVNAWFARMTALHLVSASDQQCAARALPAVSALSLWTVISVWQWGRAWYAISQAARSLMNILSNCSISSPSSGCMLRIVLVLEGAAEL